MDEVLAIAMRHQQAASPLMVAPWLVRLVSQVAEDAARIAWNAAQSSDPESPEESAAIVDQESAGDGITGSGTGSSGAPAMTYPDNHPAIRDHLITLTTPDGTAQYMPREQWEAVVAERDEYRRVLALISAWRLDSGTRDAQLDALLRRIGEDYDSARTIRGLVAWARDHKPGPVGSS